jgi:hypothetical protein
MRVARKALAEKYRWRVSLIPAFLVLDKIPGYDRENRNPGKKEN